MLPLVQCSERMPLRIPACLSLFLLSLASLLIPSANASTCTVTSTADTTDSGTLRNCLTTVNPGDTIDFGVTGTITLTSALPQITGNLTLYGSGPAVLTISGAGSYPVFSIGSLATVTMNGMTIAHGSGTNGGGISNAGTLTFDNGAFTGNIASNSGGAIYSSGTLRLDTISFSGNGSESFGGAIYNAGSGTVTVADSTFSGNRSSLGGAMAGGTLSVVNSTFSGNFAVDNGGAINSSGTLTVTNSTFSGNSTDSAGGAIYTSTGSTTANNSIFTGNFAITDGGIYNRGTLNGSNNILGGDINGECDGTGTGCFTNGASGNQVGVPVSSIGLLPLGNYGGTIETMALLPGSAAICGGLRADAVNADSSLIAFDERGFSVDDSCGSGLVDAGAVQTNQYVVNTLVDSSDGSCTSSTCSLRDAIGAENSAGGDITFLPSLTSTGTPGTIDLSVPAGGSGSTLTLGRGNIFGPGANQLTVAGDDDTNVGSVFTVNSGAQAFLYGLTITAGYAESSTGGGGIYNQGTLTVMASSISGNVVGQNLNGGGIANEGTLTLNGSTVSGNELIAGTGSGGGIYNTGTLTLTESTVAGNSVPFQSTGGGGGIFIAGGSATLTGSTVSGNTVAQFCIPAPYAPCYGGNGGGILTGGTLTVVNSIVAGNTALGVVNGNDCAGGGCPSNGSSNVIGGTPQLSGLQSNGSGTTVATMIPLPGSPAICAGAIWDVPTGVTTDERGYPNLNTTYSGYSPSAPCVDAGAVQTNYALAFTTQPPSSAVSGQPLSPAPVVTLTESGGVSTASSGTVAMTDVDADLSASGTNSVALSSGGATFSNLVFAGAASGDTLTASLSLNPNLPTPLSLVSSSSTGVNVVAGPPAITSVSPVLPQQTQTITISGTGFGTQSGYSGDSSYIALFDNSGTPWAAGHTGNGVTLTVASWTDSQIVLSGLSGNYSANGHCIRPGDQLSISVWNAQTGDGPASYSIVASAGTDMCSTVINSVSPIVSQQTQTITIAGAGFGTQAAYTGDSSYIQVEDSTGSPWFAGQTGNGVMLAVSSWTDSEIVLTGFTGSYGTNHCIRPGDHLSVSVWNAQTGIGPAVYSIVASGGTDNCPTSITSVSPIVSQQTQTITINGAGFGTQTAYTGDSPYITVEDSSGTPWYAGYTGNGVTLAVSSWTDSQIVLTGFSGSYGTAHCIRPGDQLTVSVWNVQTGAGPSKYPIVAGGGTDNCPTQITNVSPILPQQSQTITITGEGFGTQATYSGDSPYIELIDSTGNWFAGQPGNMVGLAVSSWTDSQIVITGLPGSYGTSGWCISPGDQLYVRVWNAQTGSGPATYGIVASSGTNTCS